jgi:hypothetical protein
METIALLVTLEGRRRDLVTCHQVWPRDFRPEIPCCLPDPNSPSGRRARVISCYRRR